MSKLSQTTKYELVYCHFYDKYRNQFGTHEFGGTGSLQKVRMCHSTPGPCSEKPLLNGHKIFQGLLKTNKN